LLDTMAHGSIALAFTLSKTMKVFILYGLLRKKIDDLQFAQNLRFLGKILAAVIAMLIVMSIYQRWFSAWFDLASFSGKALLIGSSGGLGTLLFFGVTFGLNVPEVHLILGKLWKSRNIRT
jgi:peptidoglycan biosynthesis protein MviN/MurJ (putative lipid II flippase)